MHYNEFMIEIHKIEHKINTERINTEDIAKQVGDIFSKEMDVLCLDEFQVVHVGDALILK